MLVARGGGVYRLPEVERIRRRWNEERHKFLWGALRMTRRMTIGAAEAFVSCASVGIGCAALIFSSVSQVGEHDRDRRNGCTHILDE